VDYVFWVTLVAALVADMATEVAALVDERIQRS